MTFPDMRDFFMTETPLKPGCTRTFCALQPFLEFQSLFLVAMTAENQELQKDYEDLGSVNVRLAFGSRNL